MSYRGVHFALASDDARRVQSTDDPDDLVDLISEDIEENYFSQKEWVCETEKAWDPIHRILGDGSLLYETGPHPLTYSVLGGTALDAGEDFTACLTNPTQVAEVSAALPDISREWFEKRYVELCSSGVIEGYQHEECDYVGTNFEDLRQFLYRAANAKRHVLFTVDV